MAYEQIVQCGICSQKYNLAQGHTCSPVAKCISSLEGMIEPGSTIYALKCVIEDLAERVKMMEKSQAELAKSIHDLIHGFGNLL